MSDNNFKYKPTTAFWKIQKLIRDGLPKFKEDQQKVFVIQGGQGAGKTIAINMLIVDYYERNKSQITICSHELTKVKSTVMTDFINIQKDFNLFDKGSFNKSESKHVKDTDHFVEFIGLDKEDVGKGRRRKIVYINEANKITLKQYTDITARADIVIIDYNPDGYFYGHDLILDFNYINLTYLDNEFLSKNEIRNILAYKEKGFINPNLEDYDTADNVKNSYWANKWRVYGLGSVGGSEARVFTDWTKNTYKEFKDLPFRSVFGVDWGKNHKFGVVECKYDAYENTLYCHQRNYLSENELMGNLEGAEYQIMLDNGGIIIDTVRKLGIDKEAYLVCDSARPDNIRLLRDYGWEYAVGIDKPKGSVMAGITLLQSTKVVYTKESDGIDLEFRNYAYAEDRLGVVDDEVIKAYDDCFTEDTDITTDKGIKKIINVNKGDLVLTSNGFKEVLHFFDNGQKEIFDYSIQFDTFSLSLSCTSNHLVKTNKGWTKISELKEGMMVYYTKSLSLTNIQKFRVVSVKANNKRQANTYDLMVDNTHEFFANGLLVHNCIDPIRYVRRWIENN